MLSASLKICFRFWLLVIVKMLNQNLFVLWEYTLNAISESCD
jgi:hypothetical protein